VLETAEEVINRIVDYRRRLRQALGAMPPVGNSAPRPEGRAEPAHAPESFENEE
jgi:hypothetical protein